MKSDGLAKPLLIGAVLAVILYVIGYNGIEHRRTFRGPWRVTFTRDTSGTPALFVNQPVLGITNLQFTFPGGTFTNEPPITLAFAQPQQVPYDLPFGRCIFMDTTFLPGTIVMEIFGHEIQLIPRVLRIDGQEQPWKSNVVIVLAAQATNQMAPAK
jgi:hypothetical protein